MTNFKYLPTKGTFKSIAILVILTGLCYAPALWNGFVNYDDPTLLFGNPLLKSLSLHHVAEIFRALLAGHYSRFNPLPFVAYMALHQWVGFEALWFHALNVVFHIGTTVMVFLWTKDLTQNHRLSFLCALLFGVHPIHVEPVAWISALTHGMYAFFYIGAMYAYSRALSSRRYGGFLIGVSFLLFVIAGTCFSGGVITLPVILGLIAAYKEKAWPKKHLLGLMPFVVLAAGFAYLTVYTAHHADVITNPYFNLQRSSLIVRIHLSVISLIHYIGQILLPYNFSPVYPEGYFVPFSGVAATITFCGALGLLFVIERRFLKERTLLFGLAFFLIVIAPFLKIYSTSDSITNDRYAYLASLGIFLLLASLIDALLCAREAAAKALSEQNRAGPKSVLVLNTLLIAGFCYLVITSWTTIFHWRDGKALWTQVLTMYPKAYPAYVGRAYDYFENGDYEKALDDCDRALGYAPHDKDALSLKGTIFMVGQHYPLAVEAYTQILNADPEDTAALNGRGAVYLLMEQSHEALQDFNRSLNIDPDQIDPYAQRATLSLRKNHYARALQDFLTVLRKQPSHPQARAHIGRIVAGLSPL